MYWVMLSIKEIKLCLVGRRRVLSKVFIDGPHNVYVMEHPVEYVVMSCDPVHAPVDEFKHEEVNDS